MVAPSPEITGRSPLGPSTPCTTIGALGVPVRSITHFSRYGSGRQWMRTRSPGPSVAHGTSPIAESGWLGPTSYTAARAGAPPSAAPRPSAAANAARRVPHPVIGAGG